MDGELPKISPYANCGDKHVSCQQVAKLQWRCKCTECGDMGDPCNNMVDAIEVWNNPSK